MAEWLRYSRQDAVDFRAERRADELRDSPRRRGRGLRDDCHQPRWVAAHGAVRRDFRPDQALARSSTRADGKRLAATEVATRLPSAFPTSESLPSVPAAPPAALRRAGNP